ncbi:MAG TPA: 50S ribosomal protein L6 [Thermoanaerobaculia bacterium]
MSRIGRMPVPIPQGVEIRSDGEFVRVKGPKGELASRIPPGIAVEVDKGEVRFARSNDEPQQRAWHGLVRSLVANSVEGVTKGFSRELEIVGVGYKAEVKGKAVVFALGYSHPINFPIPDGIAVALDAKAGKLTISGADRQKVGQTAAEIRRLRVPDPYKAKGIKYANEVIRRKVGKAGGK